MGKRSPAHYPKGEADFLNYYVLTELTWAGNGRQVQDSTTVKAASRIGESRESKTLCPFMKTPRNAGNYADLMLDDLVHRKYLLSGARLCPLHSISTSLLFFTHVSGIFRLVRTVGIPRFLSANLAKAATADAEEKICCRYFFAVRTSLSVISTNPIPFFFSDDRLALVLFCQVSMHYYLLISIVSPVVLF